MNQNENNKQQTNKLKILIPNPDNTIYDELVKKTSQTTIPSKGSCG
jgi:hypothetical protein